MSSQDIPVFIIQQIYQLEKIRSLSTNLKKLEQLWIYKHDSIVYDDTAVA